ncbi:MAG: oligosaccharide flippase family protein [Proteobacteria bacterium]|nr:oligosaccharide flippase family protein [Desulfobacula sp.]MBU3950640.1 oligosaccharide flippase family protein [Pseudomonadota bacterium]MBU4130793.1 oligosaccharide flippase family protein [Pseudomonadota bacterium]
MFIWISSGSNILFGFLIQVKLTAILSIEHYGLFSASMGVINLLVPVAGMGVASFWLKMYGKHSALDSNVVKISIRLIMIVLMFIIFSIFIYAEYCTNDPLETRTIRLLSLTIVGVVFVDLISTKLQIENKFLKYSLLQSSTLLLKFLSLTTLSFFVDDINSEVIAIVWFVITLIVISIYFKDLRIILFARPGVSIISKTQRETVSLTSVFKGSWLFAGTGVLYLVWNQGHIVYSQKLFGNYQAGIYNTAMVLSAAISLFPNVVFSKLLLPRYHQFIYNNMNALKKYFFWGNILLFSFGIFTSIMVITFSEFIIGHFFGEGYNESIYLLKLISLTFPFRFLGFNSGSIISTGDHIKVKFRALLIVSFINLLLAYYLSKVYGIVGMAMSISLSELVLVGFYIFYVKRIILR